MKLTYSEKFETQVNQYVSKMVISKRILQLQERIKKACAYFSDKTETLITKELDKLPVVTDNKVVRKQLEEAIEKLELDIAVRKACLKACSNGFTVKKYLDTRAKASIEEPTKPYERKGRDEAFTGMIDHPELYTRLKKWRTTKALSTNSPYSSRPFSEKHGKAY